MAVLSRIMVLGRDLGRSERGQDTVEYALLLAGICLSGAALFISVGQLTSSIWGIVNSRLAASNNAS